MHTKLKFLTGIIFIALLTSCVKRGFVPVPSQPAKKDTVKTGKDTTKTTDPVQKLPAGVFTTFGSNGSSWITAMHGDQPSQGPNPNQVIADAAGNIYVLFNYYGPLDIDPGTGIVVGGDYTSPAILVKYNVDGKYLWSKQFDNFGSVNAIKLNLDKAGNVYCLLHCFDADVIKFDNYTYTFKSKSKTLSVIIKFKDSGSLVWLREIGVNDGIFSSVRVDDMATDDDGNVYLGGVFDSVMFLYSDKIDTLNSIPDPNPPYPGNPHPEKSFWAKYNTDGKLLSATVVMPVAMDVSGKLSSARHTCIAVDTKQNVFICGESENNADPYVKPPNANFRYGQFITKYDKNGKWLWLKDCTGATSVRPFINFTTMIVDAQGSAYVSGSEVNYNNNNVVYKVDANGNDGWIKYIPTGIYQSKNSISIDSKGQLLVAGNYLVNPGVSPNLFTNLGIYLNKYSGDGTLTYTKNLVGYSIVSYIYLYNAAIDSKGNINVIGYFNGSIKLLNTSADPVNKPQDFSNSFFIAHFPDKP